MATSNDALLLIAARIVLSQYLREENITLSVKPDAVAHVLKNLTGASKRGYIRKAPHWTQTPKGRARLRKNGKKLWRDQRDKMIRVTHPKKKTIVP